MEMLFIKHTCISVLDFSPGIVQTCDGDLVKSKKCDNSWPSSLERIHGRWDMASLLWHPPTTNQPLQHHANFFLSLHAIILGLIVGWNVKPFLIFDFLMSQHFLIQGSETKMSWFCSIPIVKETFLQCFFGECVVRAMDTASSPIQLKIAAIAKFMVLWWDLLWKDGILGGNGMQWKAHMGRTHLHALVDVETQ